MYWYVFTFEQPSCNQMTEEIKCDGERPCSSCDKDGAPCSNCMPETYPGHADSFEPDIHNHPSNSKFEESNLTAIRLTLLGGFHLSNPAEERSPNPSLRHALSQSGAHSVASAATSRSKTSMHSARYSVKLNRRRSANSRRNSSDSRAGSRDRQDLFGGDQHLLCPNFQCLKVFSSRLSLDTHRKLSHTQNYCTFCRRSFRNNELWESHEERHIIDEVGVCIKPTFILWKCGICGTFGLSPGKRHWHITNHWQEGHTMEDWDGIPVIIALDSVEKTRGLMGLSQDVFQSTAEGMLHRPTGNVLHSNITSDFPIVQHPPTKGNSPLNTTAKEQKNFPSSRPQAVPEPARSVVHGLFASIRSKLLRSKKKPPKPP